MGVGYLSMNTVEWVICIAGAAVAVICAVIWFAVRRHRRTTPEPTTNPGLILPDAPSAVNPALLGALTGGKPGVRDLMFALIELAAGGYAVLNPLPRQRGDDQTAGPSGWQIKRTDKPLDDLADFEQTLLEAATPSATLADLFDGDTIAHALPEVRSAVEHSGWFTDAQAHRSAWSAGGGLAILIGLTAAGAALVAGFRTNPWPGLIGAALMVAGGLLLISLARVRPSITVTGEQARTQAQNYREWLRGLQPHDIVPDKATELFGANIAAAMAFGVQAPFAESFDTAIARHRAWGGQSSVDTDWLQVPPAPVARRVSLLDQLIAEATRLSDRGGLSD